MSAIDAPHARHPIPRRTRVESPGGRRAGGQRVINGRPINGHCGIAQRNGGPLGRGHGISPPETRQVPLHGLPVPAFRRHQMGLVPALANPRH